MLKFFQRSAFLFVLFFTTCLCAFAWIQNPNLRLIYTAIFLGIGIVARKSLFFVYLIFLFLYPLIPSQPLQWYLPELNLYEFLFLGLAFWWAVARLFQKNFQSVTTGIGLDISMFIGFCALSLILSITQHNLIFSEIFVLKLKDFPLLGGSPPEDLAGIYSFKIFVEGVILFFMTVDLLRDKTETLAVRIVFYSAVFVSLLGIFQYITGFNLLEHWRRDNPFLIRINSTMSDPNELGSFLAASFFLGIGFTIALAGRKRTILLIFTFTVLVATVLTVSRAAVTGILLGFFVLPALLKMFHFDFSKLLGERVRWVTRGAYIFLAILFLIVTIVSVMDYRMEHPRNIFQVAAETLNPKQPLNATLKGRVNLWKDALRIFRENPLIGSGLGRFPAIFKERFDEPFSGSENAHNYFLQLLAEIGLIGVALFLVVLVRTVKVGLQLNRDSGNQEAAYRFGLLCAVVVFLLTLLTGHPLLLLKMQFFFWGLVGFLWAVKKKSASIPGVKNRSLSPVLFSLGVLALAFSFGFSKSKQILPFEYGYYGWEEDISKKRFRWTQKETISLIEPAGCSVVFSIRQPDPKLLKSLNTEIYLNEELVDTVSLNDSEWHPQEYYFPPGQHGPLSLRMKTARTYSPRTGGSNDLRTIGVGVTPFQFRCFSEKGIGFYEKEQEDGKLFAWTKKQAAVLLEPHGNRIVIPVRPGPIATKQPVDLSIYWNGKLSRTVRLSQPEWKQVPIDLPEMASRGVLSLKVSDTWNPFRAGLSNDDRELGVQVGEFQWPEQPFDLRFPAQVTSEVLSKPTLLGFVKNRDRHNRVVFYRTSYSIYPDTQKESGSLLFRDGSALSRQTGFFESWGYPSTEKGAVLIHRGKIKLSPATPFSKQFSIPRGRFVIRIIARGVFAGDTLPLALIKLNGDVVARQPIASEKSDDYYFEIETKEGTNEISIQFINDFFDKSRKLDRNIVIDEIMVWPKQSGTTAEGWDTTQNDSVGKLLKTLSKPVWLTRSQQALLTEANCEEGIGSISITARGSLAGSDLPRLSVYMNGLRIGDIEVKSSEFLRYELDPIRLTPDRCVLSMIFENDFYNRKTGEDRNIFVSDVQVTYPSGFLVTEPIGERLPIPEYCYSADYQAAESHR